MASVLVCLCSVLLISQLGCAPSDAKGQSPAPDDEATSTQDFTWSTDAHCAVCHVTEDDSLADATSTSSFHPSLACTDCHADEGALAVVHLDVPQGTAILDRLTSTAVEEAFCLTCHGGYAALSEVTAASEILTDANGTTIDPHAALPYSDSHTFTCDSCHKFHTSDEIETTARKVCTSCHHAEVYECHTCHE